jgi:hypothetical protein
VARQETVNARIDHQHAVDKLLLLLRCIGERRCKVWDCQDGEARCLRIGVFGICTCKGSR